LISYQSFVFDGYFEYVFTEPHLLSQFGHQLFLETTEVVDLRLKVVMLVLGL
jgi:hypothetical protein